VSVHVARIFHSTHIVEDITPVWKKHMEVFGALAFRETYLEALDVDMLCMYIADHGYEPMSPRSDRSPLMPYLRASGSSMHSFEMYVDDPRTAAEEVRRLGGQVLDAGDTFFMFHPRTTGGIIVQAAADDRDPLGMTGNDPYYLPSWNPDWLVGHASGIHRLAAMVFGVPDVERSRAFFTEILDGTDLGSRAAGDGTERQLLEVAGDIISLGGPTADDAFSQYAAARNSCFYALCWLVSDLAQTEEYLTARGLRITREACGLGSFAIEPDDMFGVRHEFTTVSYRAGDGHA
jgi:catechol 2,3-dioxygenase-like lactoylglutathione lyase family enzyme